MFRLVQRTNRQVLQTVRTLGKRTFATASATAARPLFNSYVYKVAGTFSVVALTVGLSAPALAADVRPEWKKVRAAVTDILDKNADHGPFFVRLAWHSSGSYSIYDRTGGSNGGCMRFAPESNHGGNAGLDKARALLEPIKQANPGLTYADLYIYAANIAIEEMGGPKIPFKAGRTDQVSGPSTTPDGRLPDAAQGAQHVRDVFYRMGFNDREMVALIGGGHALGRCHTDRSGFDGPWTRAPTTFSNLYFKELMENTWTVRKWNGPKQYTDPSGDLMMLESDMAFRSDPEFSKWSKVYAADEELLFRDFSNAWRKLTENNVPFGTKGYYVE